MFYKFNNVVGRLAPSTQQAAYSPQGVAPLAREPSVITFDSKKTRPAQEPSITSSSTAVKRAASSSVQSASGEAMGVIPTHPRYKRIIELQNTFLNNDGRMVWQKFARDRGLYYATIAVTLLGSAIFVAQQVKMMLPKRNQD